MFAVAEYPQDLLSNQHLLSAEIFFFVILFLSLSQLIVAVYKRSLHYLDDVKSLGMLDLYFLGYNLLFYKSRAQFLLKKKCK